MSPKINFLDFCLLTFLHASLVGGTKMHREDTSEVNVDAIKGPGMYRVFPSLVATGGGEDLKLVPEVCL